MKMFPFASDSSLKNNVDQLSGLVTSLKDTRLTSWADRVELGRRFCDAAQDVHLVVSSHKLVDGRCLEQALEAMDVFCSQITHLIEIESIDKSLVPRFQSFMANVRARRERLQKRRSRSSAK